MNEINMHPKTCKIQKLLSLALTFGKEIILASLVLTDISGSYLVYRTQMT